MKALSPACREFGLALDRREITASEHAAACKACADHAAFRARIAPLLRSAPPVPAALHSPRMLEAIHERIVDFAEQTPLGRLVATNDAPPAPDSAWPEPRFDERLHAAIRSAPPAPSPIAWNEVRRSILADVAARRVARIRVGVWLGLFGIAAAALVSVLLSTGGGSDQIAIVFTDLDRPPGTEFAVLRYGALR